MLDFIRWEKISFPDGTTHRITRQRHGLRTWLRLLPWNVRVLWLDHRGINPYYKDKHVTRREPRYLKGYPVRFYKSIHGDLNEKHKEQHKMRINQIRKGELVRRPNAPSFKDSICF